jgi:hypothetical protein
MLPFILASDLSHEPLGSRGSRSWFLSHPDPVSSATEAVCSFDPAPLPDDLAWKQPA